MKTLNVWNLIPCLQDISRTLLSFMPSTTMNRLQMDTRARGGGGGLLGSRGQSADAPKWTKGLSVKLH